MVSIPPAARLRCLRYAATGLGCGHAAEVVCNICDCWCVCVCVCMCVSGCTWAGPSGVHRLEARPIHCARVVGCGRVWTGARWGVPRCGVRVVFDRTCCRGRRLQQLGSTEWVEAHYRTVQNKVVTCTWHGQRVAAACQRQSSHLGWWADINVDEAVDSQGPPQIFSTPSLSQVLFRAAKAVPQPVCAAPASAEVAETKAALCADAETVPGGTWWVGGASRCTVSNRGVCWHRNNVRLLASQETPGEQLAAHPSCWPTWVRQRPDSVHCGMTTAWVPTAHLPRGSPRGGCCVVWPPQHAGVAALDLSFSGDQYGVYHSVYDSYTWMATFGDPSFAFHRGCAQFAGTLAIMLATDAVRVEPVPAQLHLLPPQPLTPFAVCRCVHRCFHSTSRTTPTPCSDTSGRWRTM